MTSMTAGFVEVLDRRRSLGGDTVTLLISA